MKIKGFLNNIDKLAEEYELTREQVLDSFEKGIIAGCKKNCKVKSCKVVFNNNYEDFILYKQYLVIQNKEENDEKYEKDDILNTKKTTFINLDEAQKLKENSQIGDLIEIEVNSKEFNFYASKEFKNKFNEELIKKQRENIYNLFKNYENKIINAKIIDFNDNFWTLELEKKITATLSKTKTLANDNFYVGERIQVFVVEVQNTTKMPKILISRTNINFVIEIFKEFIPEIQEGLITIMGISRIPSERIKIGILSLDKKIDPVGSCIGKNGSRIKSIIDVLKGEKIDIFLWDEKPKELIKNALKPAKIFDIIDIDEKNKNALALVTEDQISVAIGKSGQNVKLATQATKWNIKIKTIN